MTPEILSFIAGIALSLAFSYIPKLNTKYAAQSEEVKKLVMLGLLFLSAAGMYALSCANFLPEQYAVPCGEQGILSLVETFILAAIANQTTYKLTPQSGSVKAVKANQ